jgi:hypothetical protein
MTNTEILTILLTGVIALTGVIGAIIFNDQLSVMQGQLDVMRADQRPWISLNMQADGPLVHDERGWHFIVKYNVTSVGKSPAANVDFVATMIPWGPPLDVRPEAGAPLMFPMPDADVRAATETACNAMAGFGAPPRDFGQIMFPGEQDGKRFSANPHGNIPQRGFINTFLVIGCATYRFLGDPTVHRTVKILEVSKNGYGTLIDLSGENVPLEDLWSFPYAGGTSAN